MRPFLNETGRIIAAFAFILVLFFAGCGNEKSEEIKGEENAILTDAPYVPPPITRDYPTKVIVNLEVKEVVSRLADGVTYNKWTFGGKVPGKFIRVREGDLVEFHLHNHPGSTMLHNIDLHAVTGPGGGAESSNTAPGHTSVFSFKVLNPGLYVYHCATPPVGLHIANGMYGLILVEPKEGLPRVDREYYVMQSEFYTQGNFGDPGLQMFDMQKAVDENPSYVVFNGEVGSLLGDRALKAGVGQTVRLFIGDGGPNLVSSFHLIGEIFDEVHMQGGSLVTQKNVGTTLIPAGGTSILQFKLEVPGTYTLVDHSYFRAQSKGCVGKLVVEGAENKTIYSGKQSDEIYLGSTEKEEGNIQQAAPGGNIPVGNEPVSGKQGGATPMDAKSLMATGQQVFAQNCVSCHQTNGQGIPNVFPPLAKSDFLMADKERSIRIAMHGLTGPVTVNGKTYNNTMPQLSLTDQQIAAVVSYIRNSFGNKGDMVSVEEVKRVRGK
ncbi:MAG: nitrite reductase, copper-containing [Ignavibacteria bacterium]|jgi:nitrite reductase (NO-forming)|nr:nitrite reductase, copper-containing [Ignavibacteria bacterium]MCU7504856.1 nitrite reductase, copper-containing [Ignavibacteria bacterium]MCU7518332.1 nitrite reductase, copper-containing [Ignavibacteria bacterium]